MVTTFELISIALVTGIGSGIGNPIGQWFYEKFLKDKLNTAHGKIQIVSDKIKNGEVKLPEVGTDEQIKRMLGK